MFSPHPFHVVAAVLAAIAVGGLGTTAAQAQPAPAKHIDALDGGPGANVVVQ